MTDQSHGAAGQTALSAAAEQFQRDATRIDLSSLHQWSEASAKGHTTIGNDRIDEAELERLGIQRVEDNAFQWGEYLYFYLSDAIAAAKQDQRK